MRELGREMATGALQDARRLCDQDQVFTLHGKEWHQLAGVVGSEYNTSTGLFAEWLPYAGAASMLEMGCGCGVAAVTGALAGCREVVAVDINPHAVASTKLNAERYGVGDRVDCVESDLFAGLEPDARFDLVFWNSPFIDGDTERADGDYFADHFFDPGYRLHERFLTELPQRLTDSGRAFLGFSSAMGDADEVAAIAKRNGMDMRPFRSESFSVPRQEMGTAEVFQRAADERGEIVIDLSLVELVR
ncbi:methyltransferase [Actinokineospora terrae]|uniref:Methyltransferase domain-containing protein n=1 Tax=Actinokineospora terrae TaxID=155974 RepID=A0A1H9KWF8_9PSEU|nr:methyltransferase [Actinokineospora terrae]SER03512.1 Methyltransferase domain-containing protein [Actinokineospora terrae]